MNNQCKDQNHLVVVLVDSKAEFVKNNKNVLFSPFLNVVAIFFFLTNRSTDNSPRQSITKIDIGKKNHSYRHKFHRVIRNPYLFEFKKALRTSQIVCVCVFLCVDKYICLCMYITVQTVTVGVKYWVEASMSVQYIRRDFFFVFHLVFFFLEGKREEK